VTAIEDVVAELEQDCTVEHRCWRSGVKANTVNELAEICAICGVEVGLHGAEHPHTRGEGCHGFRRRERRH
jgi:hypothetical protein